MMISGGNPENIRQGSSLSEDGFQGEKFDYMLLSREPPSPVNIGEPFNTIPIREPFDSILEIMCCKNNN
jgi:hypothetical protein